MLNKFTSSFALLLFTAVLISFSGCKKSETLQLTCSVANLTATVATINSTLSPAKTGIGVQILVYRGDSLTDKINRLHNGNTNFDVTGLKPNTDYKVVIQFINNPGIDGDPCTVNFTTEISNTPVALTKTTTDITQTSARLHGEVIWEGLNPVTERGICWGLTSKPTVSNNQLILGSGLGSFSYPISGLTPNTTYYVRAYAKAIGYYYYGGDSSFTTPALIPTVPTVVTTTPTNVTQTGVSTGGNVTSAGTASVTKRGICYGTSANPDTTGLKTTNGSGIGSFTVNLSTLAPSTTYHVRAYALNSVGIAYGADETFTTTALVLPTVTTTTPFNIGQTTATGGGNVTSNGGAVVTALGVCYSTTTNPTIANSITNDGSGTGGYTSPLSGLTPNTTYYIKAYATNSVGTAYGAEKQFTTLP